MWRRQTTRHLESVMLSCLKDSPKAALASAEPGNSNSTPRSGTFLTSSKVAVLTGSVTHRKSIGTNQKCVYPEGRLEEGSMNIHRMTVALGTSHCSSIHMCAQQSCCLECYVTAWLIGCPDDLHLQYPGNPPRAIPLT